MFWNGYCKIFLRDRNKAGQILEKFILFFINLYHSKILDFRWLYSIWEDYPRERGLGSNAEGRRNGRISPRFHDLAVKIPIRTLKFISPHDEKLNESRKLNFPIPYWSKKAFEFIKENKNISECQRGQRQTHSILYSRLDKDRSSKHRL